MQDKADMSEEERVRWRFEYTESVRNIQAWKAHLLRSSNQDEAKQDILEKLDSLRGRRLKGKGKAVLGKGVLGARETRGAREEGGRETPARKPLFLTFLTSTRRMLKS